MTTIGIPLDKAELLSVLLEALLYGFSLLMFGATIWTLFTQRASQRLNHRMFTVACALLLCSTAHIVIDIIRTMQGLILLRDTFPGGPSGYFSDVSQWTFVAKNYVYVIQTLVGDGVVLYRCYVVWQSKLVMVFPVLLWCAAGVIGIFSCYSLSIATDSGVFVGALSRWITSFWATALATNLLTTGLLVCRIWYVDRKTMKLCHHHQSQLRPILHILIDAGAIYSLTLLVALVCFVSETNGQYVVLDMVTPIISITFYMVIIRVGLATRSKHTTNLQLGNTSLAHSISADRRRRMQVHVVSSTESKVERSEPSPICLSNPMYGKNRPGESYSDGGGVFGHA